VEEALEALRGELSPQAEPRVITEVPPCPTTNRAAASTVLRVGVSVLASAANVSRALARGATLGDCSSELRLTDVAVSNEAPHTDFTSGHPHPWDTVLTLGTVVCQQFPTTGSHVY
jgi:hypothetical protein